MLAAYGVVAAYAYGTIMNLWFWPFATGDGTGLSYVAGAPVGTNLHRFALFDTATSLGWDTGRAITNVVAITVLGTGGAVDAAPGRPQGGLRRARRVRPAAPR